MISNISGHDNKIGSVVQVSKELKEHLPQKLNEGLDEQDLVHDENATKIQSPVSNVGLSVVFN